MQLDENGEPVGADVMDLHTERSMELRQSIRDYVEPILATSRVSCSTSSGSMCL